MLKLLVDLRQKRTRVRLARKEAARHVESCRFAIETARGALVEVALALDVEMARAVVDAVVDEDSRRPER